MTAAAVTTIDEMLTHAQPLHATRTALVFGDRRTSYADLDRLASQVASGYAALGLKPGDRVGYLGTNTDFYFEMLFGAARGGQVIVGVNWRLAPPEIEYVLNDAGIRLLVADRDFLPVLDELRARCPSLGTVLIADAAAGESGGYTHWRDSHADTRVAGVARPEDVLVQMYTSGTTGFPKGALLTHASILACITKGPLTGEDWGRWDPEDVSLVAMPLFHVGGTCWGLQALTSGASAVILPRPDVEPIIAAIQAHKITKMFIVPAVLLAILNHPLADKADFSSMREIIYGASPIPLDVLKRALKVIGCAFVQNYGMTESSGTVVYLPPEDHHPDGHPRMASCGKALPGVALAIVDTQGRHLPTGEVGEIILRSDTMMAGYWNKPEETAKALRDGWYYSGDAGYMDADGYLYIHDRVKDMIVSGGENIYPAEVEGALHGHPDVRDVAVIGVPDDRWGEAVKAIVVRRAGADLDESTLIQFARTRIAGYKVPKSVDFVAELPRNPSGKILKKDLREPYWQGRARRVN
ncbi:fatty acid--CoA ligase [Parapedomonas caeni]